MKTIIIGVMPQEQIRAQAIAIAKGEYKPKAGEPKTWFTSVRSVAEVLSDQNRALLKVIRETNPDSLAVRARIKGRQPGNLSRSLKTMSRYGLEDLQREKTQVRPVFKATGFRFPLAAQLVEFAIEPAPEGQRQFINTGLERSAVALRQVSSVLQHSNPYLSQAALGKIGQLQVQGLIFAPKPSRP